MRTIPPAIAAVVLSMCTSLVSAQQQSPGFELSPFVGYLFGGRVAPASAPGSGNAGTQWLNDHAYGGVRAAYFPSTSLGVELELSRVNGDVTVRTVPCGRGGARCDYDATLDYALVMGVLRGGGRVRPYAELGGGICRLDSLFGREGGTRSRERATASAAVGADFALTERIGLRLDARLYATDIDGLYLGPPCTTFSPAQPGSEVRPVPCEQERWLRNTALSAGVRFTL